MISWDWLRKKGFYWKKIKTSYELEIARNLKKRSPKLKKMDENQISFSDSNEMNGSKKSGLNEIYSTDNISENR